MQKVRTGIYCCLFLPVTAIMVPLPTGLCKHAVVDVVVTEQRSERCLFPFTVLVTRKQGREDRERGCRFVVALGFSGIDAV